MPLFDIECSTKKCKYQETDLMESYSDFEKRLKEPCEKCQGELRQPVTLPKFRLAQGHWERNDYMDAATHEYDDAIRENDRIKNLEDKRDTLEENLKEI